MTAKRMDLQDIKEFKNLVMIANEYLISIGQQKIVVRKSIVICLIL